ncbi:MAG: asparaginase domain-containing protein [Candidatus Levybacteria bacterium]|nr:asparaginase domain-containing protein [Candidatus Levybacteria bacterium]
MKEQKERLEHSRICFITTPGEITWTGNSKYDDPTNIAPYLNRVADIDVVKLDQIHQPKDLSKEVAEAIHSRLNEYNGFVVTAGKFDLQYIAPRLAFAFGPNLNRTIIVTGSNIPASAILSNARETLIRAAIAANTPFNEVAILFNDLILRGVSYQLKPDGSNITYRPYRSQEQNLNRYSGQLGEVTANGVEIDCLQTKTTSGKMKFLPDVESNIVSFGISPGTEPEFIEEVALRSAGLVLYSETAHLPSREPYSFLPLVNNLTRKEIPTLVLGRAINDPSIGHKLSAGERIIDKLGGITTRHMNPTVAVTKFSWVIKRVEEQIASGDISKEDKITKIKEWMGKPYVGEFGINRPFHVGVEEIHA